MEALCHYGRQRKPLFLLRLWTKWIKTAILMPQLPFQPQHMSKAPTKIKRSPWNVRRRSIVVISYFLLQGQWVWTPLTGGVLQFESCSSPCISKVCTFLLLFKELLKSDWVFISVQWQWSCEAAPQPVFTPAGAESPLSFSHGWILLTPGTRSLHALHHEVGVATIVDCFVCVLHFEYRCHHFSDHMKVQMNVNELKNTLIFGWPTFHICGTAVLEMHGEGSVFRLPNWRLVLASYSCRSVLKQDIKHHTCLWCVLECEIVGLLESVSSWGQIITVVTVKGSVFPYFLSQLGEPVSSWTWS